MTMTPDPTVNAARKSLRAAEWEKMRRRYKELADAVIANRPACADRENGAYWVRLDEGDEWEIALWHKGDLQEPYYSVGGWGFFWDDEGCGDDRVFQVDERRIVRQEP
jgi:hypothetical protein